MGGSGTRVNFCGNNDVKGRFLKKAKAFKRRVVSHWGGISGMFSLHVDGQCGISASESGIDARTVYKRRRKNRSLKQE